MFDKVTFYNLCCLKSKKIFETKFSPLKNKNVLYFHWKYIIPKFVGILFSLASRPWYKIGKVVSSAGTDHVLICALSGSGKGIGPIQTTIMTHPGSIVVNDPKGENYDLLRQPLEAQGVKVLRFNPTSTASVKYNPFDEILFGSSIFFEAIQNLCVSVIGKSADSKDAFWTDSAVNLLKMLIYYCYEDSEKTGVPVSFAKIVKLYYGEGAITDLAKKIVENSKYQFIRDAAANFSSEEAAKTLETVAAVLNPKLDPYKSPIFLWNTQCSDYVCEELKGQWVFKPENCPHIQQNKKILMNSGVYKKYIKASQDYYNLDQKIKETIAKINNSYAEKIKKAGFEEVNDESLGLISPELISKNLKIIQKMDEAKDVLSDKCEILKDHLMKAIDVACECCSNGRYCTKCDDCIRDNKPCKLHGGWSPRIALFLVLTPLDIELYSPFISLMTDQICNSVMEAEIGKNGRAPGEHQVLFLIDEASQLKNIPSIIKNIPLMRGYGGRCMFVFQSLSQINATYGKDSGDVVKDNCPIKMYFGINDKDTAKELSEIVGTTTIRQKNVSGSIGAGSAGKSKGLSYSYVSKTILTVPEIMQLDPAKAVIVKSEAPVFIINKIISFLDKRFMNRGDMSYNMRDEHYIRNQCRLKNTNVRPLWEFCIDAGVHPAQYYLKENEAHKENAIRATLEFEKEISDYCRSIGEDPSSFIKYSRNKQYLSFVDSKYEGLSDEQIEKQIEEDRRLKVIDMQDELLQDPLVSLNINSTIENSTHPDLYKKLTGYNLRQDVKNKEIEVDSIDELNSLNNPDTMSEYDDEFAPSTRPVISDKLLNVEPVVTLYNAKFDDPVLAYLTFGNDL